VIVLFEAIVVLLVGGGVFAGVTSAVHSATLARKAYYHGRKLIPWNRTHFTKNDRTRAAYLRGIRDEAQLSGDYWSIEDEEIRALDEEALEVYKAAQQEELTRRGDSYDQFR